LSLNTRKPSCKKIEVGMKMSLAQIQKNMMHLDEVYSERENIANHRKDSKCRFG